MNARIDHGRTQAHLAPLAGPACWTARTLREERDWVFQLTSAEADEIQQALDACGTGAPETIRAEDFELPLLSPKLRTIRRTLLEGKGLALLRGLPLASLDETATARVLWLLGLQFGVPQPQDAAGALIHHIRDTGARVAGRDNIRTFQTNEAQPWHNDGGDMFMLMCKDVARTGGKSFVASIPALFNAVLERDPRLAAVLQEDFYFDARGQQLPGHGPVQRVPIFIAHGGHMFMLHKRHYLELGQRFEDVPRLTPLQRAAVDAIETICDDPEFHLAFDLEPGDLEMANNFTVLHKRSAFDQEMASPSERHMLRLWLGLPDGWPLPEQYRATREYGPLFGIRARALHQAR